MSQRRHSLVPETLPRRAFLSQGAVAFAAAGLSACTRQPLEKIIPYVKQPEDLLLGEPLHYATSALHGGYGFGVIATSHEGRPTKLEGNPQHSASLGATDAVTQAEILTLYDPDRSRVITKKGTPASWLSFLAALKTAVTSQTRVRILTETVTSPVLASILRHLLHEFPLAQWHQFEPAGRECSRAAALTAFGKAVEVRYDFSRADVIVALGGDFLSEGPGRLKYSRDFSQKRRVTHEKREMCRLFSVETEWTLTGAAADHRIALRPSDIPSLAGWLAAEVAGESSAGMRLPGEGIRHWVEAAARDLRRAQGRSIVYPGEYAPVTSHVLAHAMNFDLGNFGNSVFTTLPVESRPVNQGASLAGLSHALLNGDVDALLILEANPVYSAPSELDFANAIRRASFSLHMGLYADETADLCQWHVPAPHFLETWGDARAFDGLTGIIQPLILPLHESHSILEILTALTGESRDPYETVRVFWEGQHESREMFSTPPPAAPFEEFFRQALRDGVIEGTTLPPIPTHLLKEAVRDTISGLTKKRMEEERLELNLRPDPSLFDGRHANNGWLQELPKPMTKVMWENCALVSPCTASTLHWSDGDLVTLRTGSGEARLPVLIQPGHADEAITAHLGFGRRRSGRHGNEAGANVYPLRAANSPWTSPLTKAEPTGQKRAVAATQYLASRSLPQDRRIQQAVPTATLSRYLEESGLGVEGVNGIERGPCLYTNWTWAGHAWGLVIDLAACTGCGACVVACQAENNIPFVGREQAGKGREMHWLRVDQYTSASSAGFHVDQQPVMCQQCELAPCETVCPVGATSHSPEGLNDMTYARCAGSRYCANNCPYEARRFNFLEFNQNVEPVSRLGKNPDVTVRSRGVMEKCTYCVQRINRARVAARVAGRPLAGEEIKTACQQVCASQAIVFGDLNDPASTVSQLRRSLRAYTLLGRLNTRPRTVYLARIRNPNALLESR